MREPRWLHIGITIVYLSSCFCTASAQKLDVSVLYRQDSDINYFAVVPGYSSPAASEVSPNCALDPNPADCSPNTQANGLLSSQGEVTYNVVGTTLSLLLPDGRVALVNCVNKYSPKGNYINRRSCAMPLVDHVQAEFNGKTAKLKWSTGPEGKAESETYKVVTFLDKQFIAKR
jgi:hypothetical protein